MSVRVSVCERERESKRDGGGRKDVIKLDEWRRKVAKKVRADSSERRRWTKLRKERRDEREGA